MGRSGSPLIWRSLKPAISRRSRRTRAAGGTSPTAGRVGSLALPLGPASAVMSTVCSIVRLAAKATRSASERGLLQKCKPLSIQASTAPPPSCHRTRRRRWKSRSSRRIRKPIRAHWSIALSMPDSSESGCSSPGSWCEAMVTISTSRTPATRSSSMRWERISLWNGWWRYASWISADSVVPSHGPRRRRKSQPRSFSRIVCMARTPGPVCRQRR